MLSQERLKEILSYDPDSGVFVHKNKNIKCGKNKIGIDGKQYETKRLAFMYMKGYFPSFGVKRTDGSKDNNKWENLEERSPIKKTIKKTKEKIIKKRAKTKEKEKEKEKIIKKRAKTKGNMNMSINPTKLKELLDYNPETGIFTNKNSHLPVGHEDKRNFVRIKLYNKEYRAHKLAFMYMGEKIPKYIRHIDGDHSNNKWSNLEEKTLKGKSYVKNKNVLTQEDLKKFLEYKPYTGLFYKDGEIVPGVINQATGYRHTKVQGSMFAMHRLAFLYMAGRMPRTIKHLDGNKNNNKWNNLCARTRRISNI